MAAIITARAASGFGFSQDDIVARMAAAIAADVERAKVRRDHCRFLESEGIRRDVGIQDDRPRPDTGGRTRTEAHVRARTFA